MFRDAIEIARRFTFPVVISRKTIGGECYSGLGTFVVVNREGWIVTAAHIFELAQALAAEVASVREHKAKVEAIDKNTSIDFKEKKKRLRQLGHLPVSRTEQVSVWWAPFGTQLVDTHGFGPADVAIGRLDPFDPSSVSGYPTFKDTSRDFRPGTSLCKLGFPFHNIKPIWHEDTQQFELPVGAFPLTFFPIDGIFTRGIDIDVGGALPMPVRFVETSTPGLRGQSGGPTFDSRGTIWAIQSKTMHLPLGFDPQVPGGKQGEKEHQFLNVGHGAHPDSFIPFFKQFGVNFTLSDY